MNVTPPVEIAAWIACLTFLVMLFNAAAKAWFTLRGKPSPIEQQAETNGIASRVSNIETCIGACKIEQDRRLDDLETAQDRMRELLSSENGKIYNRINAVADSCATIVGELKGLKDNTTMLLQESLRRPS